MELTAFLWRRIGGFMDIKGIGACHAASTKIRQSFSGDFWRALWVWRCGGHIFKSPRRNYKFDVMVFFAKDTHRAMRLCTSVPRYYVDWHDAVAKRRRYLKMETKHYKAAIMHMVEQMAVNKRKLDEITRVDEKARAYLRAVEAYGNDATGPMKTQRRRIQQQLAASNQNPWEHYYA